MNETTGYKIGVDKGGMAAPFRCRCRLPILPAPKPTSDTPSGLTGGRGFTLGSGLEGFCVHRTVFVAGLLVGLAIPRDSKRTVF